MEDHVGMLKRVLESAKDCFACEQGYDVLHTCDHMVAKEATMYDKKACGGQMPDMSKFVSLVSR